MSESKTSRRGFLQHGIAAGTVTGLAFLRMTASSYGRVIGANERINIGLIGCGGRGRSIIKNMVKPANAHTSLVAISDIWKLRLDTYPDEAGRVWGVKPKAYADYRRLLEHPGLDAVIIATPAHQHCGQTIDAVEAGKHVYVEKPIASVMQDFEVLNQCYDTVKASKLAVQNGSQGVSCPGARAIKKFIAEGKLGKLFRIESNANYPVPYWVRYKGPKTETETDWKAFLYNRKDRPFDAHMHASWMGYHEFSSGPIGGWMAHFINLVHFVTGCDDPIAATAYGGKYAPANDPRCDAPDQTTVNLDYAEGFCTQFVTHFGSSIDNETTKFMFEKGTLRTRFGHHVGNPVYSGEGVNGKIAEQKLLDADPLYPGRAHVENWFDCMRNGKEPNANMDYGHKQGIAVLMGDAAYSLGRKVTFDKEKRKIRPAEG